MEANAIAPGPAPFAERIHLGWSVMQTSGSAFRAWVITPLKVLIQWEGALGETVESASMEAHPGAGLAVSAARTAVRAAAGHALIEEASDTVRGVQSEGSFSTLRKKCSLKGLARLTGLVQAVGFPNPYLAIVSLCMYGGSVLSSAYETCWLKKGVEKIDDTNGKFKSMMIISDIVIIVLSLAKIAGYTFTPIFFPTVYTMLIVSAIYFKLHDDASKASRLEETAGYALP